MATVTDLKARYGEVKLPSLDEVRAEKAKRRMAGFTKYTMPEYRMNWHHEVTCAALDMLMEGSIKRLMLFMPPRHGKSELGSRRFPAYALGKNPNLKIIATSYSADLASLMNRDVQRIIDDEQYKKVFPNTHLNESNVRTTAHGNYLRNNDIFEPVGHKGYYRSAGIGGGITGMGFDIGIVDDPIKNRKEAESPVMREAVWSWYTSTFYTRKQKDARILIILTRWHEDDLAGRLLAAAKASPKADQWTVIDFPAMAIEGEIHEQDPRSPGQALWESDFPLQDLETIKHTAGPYEWMALYQQRPSNPAGELIKREWLEKRHSFCQLPDLSACFDRVMVSVDCTFKDTEGTDYVTMGVWGQRSAGCYLLDQVRSRLSFVQTCSTLVALLQKWQARGNHVVSLAINGVLIEDKANGPAVINVLQSEVPGLCAVTPEGGKQVRVMAAQPWFAAGNIYLPEPEDWPGLYDYIEELVRFPTDKHDDQVDQTTQFIVWAQKNPLLYGREIDFLPGGGAPGSNYFADVDSEHVGRIRDD